ncbi:MAG: mevalonate kinase [Thermoplasmata archaeon]|nr:mevalonate kinase [Thermoplasmata archaeon]
MGTGSGFGKVILFGEHFVVHGNHSIVSAIHNKTTAMVEDGTRPGVEMVDDRPASEGYKEAKLEHQKKSVQYVLEAMNIDLSAPLKITLGGDLFCASGVGASAASCTAIARALADHFHRDLSTEEINQLAWEGERGYHGSPSGVDNTASTYGGLLWFLRAEGGIEYEQIDIERPLLIVMGNSGSTANTKAAVAKVKKLKESDPGTYKAIADKAEEAAHKGKTAIGSYDLEALGLLMDENHALLQEVGVSNQMLDRMVEVARENGAIGAKLTGGGLGGYMVALVRDQEAQRRVANALKPLGDKVTVLETSVG